MRLIKNHKKYYCMFTVVILVIVFFMESYGDVFITTGHGISLWDCLFAGDIRNFYNYTYTISGVQYSPSYDFGIYIIFAIWNLPLWIIKKVFKVADPLATFGGQCWGKSISLVFLFLTAICFFQIQKKILKDSDEMYKFTMYFCSSLYILAFIIIMGQYDIIVLFFMLLGLKFYLDDNDSMFVLLFGLACSIKLFALFTFFVMLIYKEKNILKVIGKFFACLFPLLMFRMLIPIYGEDNVGSFFNRIFFTNVFNINISYVSVFILVYLILCIYIFFFKLYNKDIKELLYYIFLVNVLLTVFGNIFSYWMIYFVPFMYLLFAVNNDMIELNMTMDTIGAFFALIAHFYDEFWTYSSGLSFNMGIAQLVKKQSARLYTMHDLLLDILGETTATKIQSFFVPLCMTVFITCLLMIVVCNQPNKVNKVYLSELNMKQLYGATVFLRLLFSMVILIMPMVFYLRA